MTQWRFSLLARPAHEAELCTRMRETGVHACAIEFRRSLALDGLVRSSHRAVSLEKDAMVSLA